MKSKLITWMFSLILLMTCASSASASSSFAAWYGTTNTTSYINATPNGTGGSVDRNGNNLPTNTTATPSAGNIGTSNTLGTTPVNVIPSNGYHIKSISWCDAGTSSWSPGTWHTISITAPATGTTTFSDISRQDNHRYLIYVVFEQDIVVDGTYKVSWGTDGSNGTGGSASSTPSISNGTAVGYTGAHTYTINITPSAGYIVSSVQARKTTGNNTNFGAWTTLNDNGFPMVVLNGTNTTITLDTSQVSSHYQDFEIGITFAAITVNVSWGDDATATNGNGGSVTPPSGKTVTNTNNVTPTFNAGDTATFSITTGSGNSVTAVEYLRDDSVNWSTVPGWSSGNTTFSFSIASHSWSVRVKFHTPQIVTRTIVAYYGTTNTSNYNTNPADWLGGNVYHDGNQLGTASLKTDGLSGSWPWNNETIRITPSSGYKIVSVKYAVASWTDTDPTNISISGSFTNVTTVQRYNQFWNDLTLPTTYDSQFTFSHPNNTNHSYVVWVVFAPVGATGGTVGAWYGTNNTAAYDTPNADGSGGTVWKTTGTDAQLTNRNSAGVTLTSDGSVTFEARPANGFKVTKVAYVDSYLDPTNTNWVTVSYTDPQTTPLPFSFNVTSGHTYKIWVVFTSTAATTFQVSGTIDTANTPAACTSNSITTTPQVVNTGTTANFTLSTSNNCMLDCISYQGAACNPASTFGGSVVGSTFTTPAITATTTFTVRFKTVGFNIVSEIDTASPSGCGTISPLGTNNYSQGTNATYTITTSASCAISHIWITDTDVGYTSDTDIAPLAGSSYTFVNIQAAGHIKVQYTSVVPTSSNSYCQVPAFVAGQAGLAPNVLIIFDNSGSMAESTYNNIKTYNCTSSSTLSNCNNFYGYFEPGKMYKTHTGNSSQYDIDSVTVNLSQTNGLSGNYLNYLHMRKTDLIRKALMGGKVVDRTATTKFLRTDSGKTVEYGTGLPTGIVQDMAGRVRFGIMVFNDPPEGGHIANVPSTTRKAVLGATVDDLIAVMEGAETDPQTNTPTSETLYEAVRYFQAKPSAYNSGVDYATLDPVQNSCQKHFIMLVTDGEPNSNNNLPGLTTQPTMNGYTDTSFNVTTWENRIPANDRADSNTAGCLATTYKCPPGSNTNCATNSEKVEAVSYYMHDTDLRPDKEGTQNITLYSIYAFGNGTGTKTLQMAAKYGGFVNSNGNLPSPNTWASPDVQTEWNAKGDCVPDNYFEADDGGVLESNIRTAMSYILAKVASGTAASILSNSQGSGANLLQAVFYPDKIFPGPTTSDSATEAKWIGELQNLWYYVDPFITYSSVREDTDFSTTTPNHILDLKKDYITKFYFDSASGETLVELDKDSTGSGVGDTVISMSTNPDAVKSLWRAGKQLWARTADSRTIHTSVDGYSLLPSLTASKGGFYTTGASDTNVTALQPYLQAANNDSNGEAMKLISYIRGTDSTGYRNRTVSLAVGGTTYTREWKLGDIVSSTPKLQSTSKLSTYDLVAPAGYNDTSYNAYLNTTGYLKRGMVYVGANDGMLHAFKLGKLTAADGANTGIVTTGTNTLKIGGSVKAALTNSASVPTTTPVPNSDARFLGEEQWAYIPRNALPYLKYFTDAVSYNHIFYVDGPTVLSDISVGLTTGCSTDYSLCAKDNTNGSNWKSVLIGSMGLGGASRVSTSTCLNTASGGGTCVKTPILDPGSGYTTTGVGYSSYFALDISNQYFNDDGTLNGQPTLKWEFPPRGATDSLGLGYSTSGAAIIRIAAKDTTTHKPDNTKNGKWFAVFASGPTGPIDTSAHRFIGRSDQNLKLFVIDLGATIDASHPFTLNTNYWVIDTGIANAFGGSMINAAIDTDRWNSAVDGNYQDDALYVGYSMKRVDASSGEISWTDGGVGRILTKESTDPATWTFGKVIDGIGSVTTSISRLQDRTNKKLWLFFGTGRFYYTGDDTINDTYNQRYIMGVQEPCYTAANVLDPACSASVLTLSDMKDQTTSIATALTTTQKGWYVQLDAKDSANSLGAERCITDTVALTNGSVYFTTFKPTTDVCKYGGYSYVWGVNYKTGGAAPAAALSGKILEQVSTGAFEEVTLSTALSAMSGRKMSTPMIGKPPGDAPPVISNSNNKPVKKILHLQEK